MEQTEQNTMESESVRLIAVEDLKQNQQLSFKAMLDLFYLQSFSVSAEKEPSRKSKQPGI